MHTSRKRLFLLTPLVLAMILPTAALAAPSFPYWGPLVSCGPGTGGAQTCTSLCDLLYTGQNVLYFAMSVALLILGPVMIVVGGLMIATSAGSEERIKTGRKVITGAVIGVLIMLAAYVIIASFLRAVGANVGTGADQVPWPDIQCNLH